MEKKTKNKQPLERHKKILENLGKGKTLGEAMKDAGYSQNYADNPQQLRKTKSWETLIETVLSDDKLIQVHSELLNSSTIDHLTFPVFIESKSKKKKVKGEQLTDEEITELLKSVNCVVKKIVHGEQARHVYFWSADNMARDKALDKAYKLKGKYEPEEYNLKFKGFSKEQLVDLILGKITKQKQ